MERLVFVVNLNVEKKRNPKNGFTSLKLVGWNKLLSHHKKLKQHDPNIPIVQQNINRKHII